MKNLEKELKKYGAETLVPINLLEVNPYEFEGHAIAVVVQFKKIFQKTQRPFIADIQTWKIIPMFMMKLLLQGSQRGLILNQASFHPG